jgi:thioredoxin reductase
VHQKTLRTSRGETISYKTLIVATGAKVRRTLCLSYAVFNVCIGLAGNINVECVSFSV